jgi:tetratricopeptide (TPR) repeat protein
MSSPIIFMHPKLQLSTRVLAQTVDVRKAEADKLLQQARAQLEAGQSSLALQSLERALKIYIQIKDRKGEAQSLSYLSIVYSSLGEYQKALEYQ